MRARVSAPPAFLYRSMEISRERADVSRGVFLPAFAVAPAHVVDVFFQTGRPIGFSGIVQGVDLTAFRNSYFVFDEFKLFRFLVETKLAGVRVWSRDADEGCCFAVMRVSGGDKFSSWFQNDVFELFVVFELINNEKLR